MAVKQTTDKPKRVGDGTPGPGRPKGSHNKTTTALKEMILQALDEASPGGGIEYLKLQSVQNPVAFMSLVGKVLPMTVTGTGDKGEHIVAIEWRRAN